VNQQHQELASLRAPVDFWSWSGRSIGGTFPLREDQLQSDAVSGLEQPTI
jgi:hypothetical protein